MGPETAKAHEPCDSSCSWEVQIVLRCCSSYKYLGDDRVWSLTAVRTVMIGILGLTITSVHVVNQQAKFLDNALIDR